MKYDARKADIRLELSLYNYQTIITEFRPFYPKYLQNKFVILFQFTLVY